MGQLKLDGLELINLFNKDGEQTLQLTGDQGLVVSGKITFPDNKAAEWPNGSIRAEGNTLKLVATTLIDLQDNTQIQGKLHVNTTSNASSAPLHVGNANGGNWNDGIVIDDATGWAATVYKRSNSPKMFTGLYNGTDNFIFMSTGYSNTSTGITAPRADAVLRMLPGSDIVEHYLPNYFGREMTIQANNTGNPDTLTLYNIANGQGAGIRFSDQGNSAQKGYLHFYHADNTNSQGGGALFQLSSNEDDLVLAVGNADATHGRITVWGGANNSKPDYGFAQDTNTGMLRTGADNIRFVTEGAAVLELDDDQNVRVVNKLGISSVNTSYNLYNDGTTYLNGATTIDDALDLTGTNRALKIAGTTRINSVGDGLFTSLYIGGTNVIDTSRNITNINNITASQLTIDDYIYHASDSDTYIYFTDNKQTFRAAGNDMLMVERLPAASAPSGGGYFYGAYAPQGLVAQNLGGANMIKKGTDIAVSTSQREEVVGPDGSRKVQAHVSTGDGNNAHCYHWYSSENVRIDPEKDYEFSVWIKSTGDDHLYLGWHEYKANGGKISGNPYFHTGKIKTYANDNNNSSVAIPNVNGWVLLKYQLKSHRTTSGQADTEGTDRYASQGNIYQHSGSTGVMHSTTTHVHLRLGSCYGSVNGSKSYFYNPKITEAQNDDIKHFLKASEVTSFDKISVPQGKKILLDGRSGHTYITEESDSNLKFYVGGSERLNLTNTDLYISGDIKTNEQSLDIQVDNDATGGNVALNFNLGTLTPVAVKYDTNDGSYLELRGNLWIHGGATTTNQAREIKFTGFDKEGTSDFSDIAKISHTTNTGGHSGSVLLIQSQNDANDGIAFATNGSSNLKHNSNVIWTAGNDGSSSGLDADLLDGQEGSYYLNYNNFSNTPTIPSGNFVYTDTTQTISGTKTFSAQTTTFNGDTLHNGHIYGRSVNNQYSVLYRFGGLFLTWDSDSYGTNFHHSITSTRNGSYSDAITINSYGDMRINFDSNNNDSGTFSIGHHTTGTSNTCLEVSSAGYLTINPNATNSFGGFILKTQSTGGIRLESAGDNQIRFYAFEGNELYIGADNAANMRLMTDQSTRFFNHIIPNVDSSYDLGTTSLRFRNLYADTLYGDGSNLTGISVSGNFITSDADDITTGEIKFRRNDTQVIIESENTSASNASQFQLKHSYGNVEIRNLRGAMNVFGTNTVNLGHGTNIKLATVSTGVQVTGSVKASSSIGNLAEGTNGQQMEYGSTAVTTLRYDADNWRLYAGAGAGEVFTVEQTGKVGIKDSTPDYPLDVNHNVSGISIYASHDIAAYSDERVKKDIETIPDALDKVSKLRGVTFKRTDEGSSDKTHMGVIAQEIQEIIPEVVTERPSDGHLSVSYGNVVGVLIEAIKELKAEVEELKKCGKCNDCNCNK